MKSKYFLWSFFFILASLVNPRIGQGQEYNSVLMGLEPSKPVSLEEELSQAATFDSCSKDAGVTTLAPLKDLFQFGSDKANCIYDASIPDWFVYVDWSSTDDQPATLVGFDYLFSDGNLFGANWKNTWVRKDKKGKKGELSYEGTERKINMDKAAVSGKKFMYAFLLIKARPSEVEGNNGLTVILDQTSLEHYVSQSEEALHDLPSIASPPAPNEGVSDSYTPVTVALSPIEPDAYEVEKIKGLKKGLPDDPILYMGTARFLLNPVSRNRLTVHFLPATFNAKLPRFVTTTFQVTDPGILGTSIALGPTLDPWASTSDFWKSDVGSHVRTIQAALLLHLYCTGQSPWGDFWTSTNLFAGAPLINSDGTALGSFYLGIGWSHVYDWDAGIDFGYGWDFGNNRKPSIFISLLDYKL